MNELRDLREEVRSGSNRNEPADFIKLKKEIDVSCFIVSNAKVDCGSLTHMFLYAVVKCMGV